MWWKLIVASARTFNRLRSRLCAIAPDLGMVPSLLLAGFVAQLVCAFFLTQGYSLLFTLSFAVAASLNRIAAPKSTPAHV